MSHKRLFVAVLLAMSLSTGAALAHAKLTMSTPAKGATVASPALIEMHFDDALVTKVSSVKVTDVDGTVIPVTMVDTKDNKQIAAKPNKALAPGLYTVTWTAAAEEDGHKMTGSFSFTVK